MKVKDHFIWWGVSHQKKSIHTLSQGSHHGCLWYLGCECVISSRKTIVFNVGERSFGINRAESDMWYVSVPYWLTRSLLKWLWWRQRSFVCPSILLEIKKNQVLSTYPYHMPDSEYSYLNHEATMPLGFLVWSSENYGILDFADVFLDTWRTRLLYWSHTNCNIWIQWIWL